MKGTSTVGTSCYSVTVRVWTQTVINVMQKHCILGILEFLLSFTATCKWLLDYCFLQSYKSKRCICILYTTYVSHCFFYDWMDFFEPIWFVDELTACSTKEQRLELKLISLLWGLVTTYLRQKQYQYIIKLDHQLRFYFYLGHFCYL